MGLSLERANNQDTEKPDPKVEAGKYKRHKTGYAAGQAKTEIEIAQNLKRLGVPIATIAEATRLPVSEVERLG